MTPFPAAGGGATPAAGGCAGEGEGTTPLPGAGAGGGEGAAPGAEGGGGEGATPGAGGGGAEGDGTSSSSSDDSTTRRFFGLGCGRVALTGASLSSSVLLTAGFSLFATGGFVFARLRLVSWGSAVGVGTVRAVDEVVVLAGAAVVVFELGVASAVWSLSLSSSGMSNSVARSIFFLISAATDGRMSTWSD